MLSGLKQRLRLWMRYQTEIGSRGTEIVRMLQQQEDAAGQQAARLEDMLHRQGDMFAGMSRQLGILQTDLEVQNALLANARINTRIGLRRAAAAGQPPAAIALPDNSSLSEIEIAAAQPDDGRAMFDLLRRKWGKVPGSLVDRVETDILVELSPRELRDCWTGFRSESSLGPGHSVRGWCQDMYAQIFRGKRVLEIGSGMGIDGLHFIKAGASWHFADIVQSNLDLIARELDAFGLSCEGFTWLQDFRSFDALPDGFDFIFASGSLINLPFSLAREETLLVLPHLRPGGRWVELCYPRERWVREGAVPFADWGRMTDGERTPWMEWYDLARLRQRFDPVKLRDLLAFNFHDDDFNWFDLAIDRIPPAATLKVAAHQPPAEVLTGWPEICQYAEAVSLTGLIWRHRALLEGAPGGTEALAPVSRPVFVRVVDPADLDAEMGWQPDGWLDGVDRRKPYAERRAETDDAVILAHLYRAAKPRRHLHFGTAEGFGATLCVGNCDAEITRWDGGDLADASFDTVLIDGGDDPAAIASNTNQALRLLRPGGLVIWQGFCLSDDVMRHASATRAMAAAWHTHWPIWSPRFDTLFWIRDSYILLGQLAQ